MEYSIKKVKRTDVRSVELKYIQFESGKFYAEHQSNIAREITDDFRNAFSRLKMHALCLCELIPEHKAKDYFRLSDESQLDYARVSLSEYEVTGLSRGGLDETEGVVIVIQKRLKSKKVLNICTPFQMFEDPESDYEYIDELFQDVNNLWQEAIEYLNGKYKKSQMELFTTDEHEENSELVSEVVDG